MLMSLAQRVNQTQLQEKDPDAENLLGRELGANADALYILAQTVLVQDIALQQAKAQVTQLQQQVQQQPAKTTSFLGGLFGRHDSPQPGQVPQPGQFQQPGQPAPPPQAQSQPGQAPPYQPVPPYQQAPYPPQQPQYYPPPGQPQYGQPQYPGAPAGQSSFLRGAMQTAAGVAAGALAFEGVESILHGFGHPGGYMGGFGGGMAGMGMGPGMGLGGGFERPVEETVVNNYYDQPGPGERAAHHESGDQFAGAAGGAYNNPDAAYNNPDASGSQGGAYENTDANFAQNDQDVGQGGYDRSLADDSSAYDNSVADVQIDDSGSGLDDGGGGFDNSDSSGF